MNTLLSALGKSLAERWVQLLALPGALFTALAATASVLGHRHALDWRRLSGAAEDLVARYDRRPVSALLLAVALLLVGAAVGLLARGLGSLVERVWLAAGPEWLVGRLVRRRKARWNDEADAVEHGPAAAEAAHVEARNAVALTEPARPTWIGDRLRAVGVRVHGQYGLDFPFTWPRLWIVLPEPCRGDLIAARQALTSASAQSGWGLLYLCLGIQWWPAAGVGVGLLLLGRRRGRDAAGSLADLAESAVDLYAVDLARALGEDPPSGRVTPALGRRLSERFRKGA
ncbi:hypothetical protein [Streptomyces vietnamensis]|uniref:Vegetative cell wall protein gp1 n=1 Tax=Streptomyces vietnamensis TaxID=362257 RepID=A0A0B5HZS1_9ACTN|nr:hypothetical protein [Streptomyces vietnamensis]AJF67430.1 hypothetical protein SVTN_26690 [Streptomyces vietnamensis]